jgi:hypothetical protein
MAPRAHDVAGRLAIVYRLTRVVADVFGPSVATGFLRSANPQLNGNSPLLVLRDGDPDGGAEAPSGGHASISRKMTAGPQLPVSPLTLFGQEGEGASSITASWRLTLAW